MKKIVIVISLLLFGLGIFFYPGLSSTLYIATGFTAKNICSGHFISGFKPKKIVEEALKPIDDAFDLVNFEIDAVNKKVTTKVFGLFERQAIYRNGLGCTLLAVGQNKLDTTITPLAVISQSDSEPWPSGLANVDTSIHHPQLVQVIDSAFSESQTNGKRNVKAVVIIHQGQLIAERYAKGVDPHTPLLGWSMAKSITNLQVGLLVKSGQLDLYAPANVPQWSDNEDPRSAITLDQLMRMSSGLEFNETYDINTDVSKMLSVVQNAGDFAAGKQLAFSPDTHWAYSSGTTNIISGIVKRTINEDFQQYYQHAQQQLFHPLGIYTAIQETDGSDTFIGSSYFYASARDWAKLGQLMLNNGQWLGKQLLPADWVKYSTTATKTSVRKEYGAQFWLNAYIWPTAPRDTFYMGGFQGQYVIVIPSQQLVIVRMGFSTPGTERGVERLIRETIKVVTTK